MAFSKGQSPNPRGRPRGSKTTARIPITVERAVIKQLSERALSGEHQATNLLAQVILQQSERG